MNSFRYIDKVLYAWNKKGYKTKKDVIKDKEQRFTKKEKETVINKKEPIVTIDENKKHERQKMKSVHV